MRFLWVPIWLDCAGWAMIRYVIKPGHVTSRTDGQRHFVGFNDLLRLYRLRREECICWPSEHEDPVGSFTIPQGCIVIEPRYDGNYSLIESGADMKFWIECKACSKQWDFTGNQLAGQCPGCGAENLKVEINPKAPKWYSGPKPGSTEGKGHDHS